MITADPQTTISAIWERLADEHGVNIAYPTLRAYVTSRRAKHENTSQSCSQPP